MQIKRIFKDILFGLSVFVTLCIIGVLSILYHYDMLGVLIPKRVKVLELRGMSSQMVVLDVDNDQSDCIEFRVSDLKKAMDIRIEVKSIDDNKLLYNQRYTTSYENRPIPSQAYNQPFSFYIQPEIKEVEISIISTLKESNVKVEIVSLEHCIN